MPDRNRTRPDSRQRPGTKPGTTREQRERRERFERARRESLRPDDEIATLYGWHTVKAALENPARRVRKLLATENAARRLAEEKRGARNVKPEIVRPDAIAERLSADAVHQGLYLEADPLPSPPIEEIAPQGVVLVLDQITDPHNVGAIFRSAAAFAASAIVTTARHSPEATGVLAKSASGALEHVPLITVQNLSRGLTALKERGFFVVGLDSSGDSDLAGAAAAPAARSGARRRRPGPAAIDQGDLRSRRAARTARRDQEPQRVERRGARALHRERQACRLVDRDHLRVRDIDVARRRAVRAIAAERPIARGAVRLIVVLDAALCPAPGRSIWQSCHDESCRPLTIAMPSSPYCAPGATITTPALGCTTCGLTA